MTNEHWNPDVMRDEDALVFLSHVMGRIGYWGPRALDPNIQDAARLIRAAVQRVITRRLF